MIDPESFENVKQEILERMIADSHLLNTLRAEIAPIKNSIRQIQPRSTTSISLVGTDGGNNKVQYDPFMIQLIRVVDSSNNEYCLEAVSPTTSISQLSFRHISKDGEVLTPLGNMLSQLGCTRIDQVSHMIKETPEGQPVSPTWVQVYRELNEWAILLQIVQNKDFGTDTLIVFDGLLRSKIFAGTYFAEYRELLNDAIQKHKKKSRRNVFIVGLAKHSKVLTRYRLAMALENIMNSKFPCYVEIPRDIESKAYVWQEYARGDDESFGSKEVNKFVGGKMFFVKFGKGVHDPIWPVDIFSSQTSYASTIIGHLLADAENGFPVPFYPMCLQKAHENAALVDFDFDIIQDQIFDSLRIMLKEQAHIFDELRFQDADPAKLRYD